MASQFSIGDLVTPNKNFMDVSNFKERFPPPWKIIKVRPANNRPGDMCLTFAELPEGHEYYTYRFDRVETERPYDPSLEPDDVDDV